MTGLRLLFLAVVIVCAASIALLSVGLTQQGNNTKRLAETNHRIALVGCRAANRALTSERRVWDRVERATEADWKQHPPTPQQRRRATDFFNGVKDDLKPAHC